MAALLSDAELLLSDALGQVRVQLATPSPVSPGDLAVVEGVCREGVVEGARLRSRYAAPETAADTEFSRLAWTGVGKALKARANAMRVVREYFAQQEFVEVDTPVRVKCPQLDAGLCGVPASGGWLVASPEYQMKRLVVGGLPRIYQLVHCSRSEELGSWHEPEFMMLEWYRAYAGLDEILCDTETIVCEVMQRLSGKSRILAPGTGLEVEVLRPFERLSVADAFLRFTGVRDVVELAAHDEDRYFALLVGEVEPALASMKRPVFLTDYPRSQAALARPKSSAPDFAERVELYLGGIELCNGYEELTDPGENAARLRAESARRRARGEDAPVDERFLAALLEGMPPTSGNALGFDRLIALALGTPGIAEIQALPASRL